MIASQSSLALFRRSAAPLAELVLEEPREPDKPAPLRVVVVVYAQHGHLERVQEQRREPRREALVRHEDFLRPRHDAGDGVDAVGDVAQRVRPLRFERCVELREELADDDHRHGQAERVAVVRERLASAVHGEDENRGEPRDADDDGLRDEPQKRRLSGAERDVYAYRIETQPPRLVLGVVQRDGVDDQHGERVQELDPHERQTSLRLDPKGEISGRRQSDLVVVQDGEVQHVQERADVAQTERQERHPASALTLVDLVRLGEAYERARDDGAHAERGGRGPRRLELGQTAHRGVPAVVAQGGAHRGRTRGGRATRGPDAGDRRRTALPGVEAAAS